jgi:hypothetical protein
MSVDDRPFPDEPEREREPEPIDEAPLSAVSADDRQWGLFAHLSGILASFVGFSFLGPLIVWLIKKDQSKFVDFHGKEALNFQLNIFVLVLISIPLMCVVVGIFTAIAAGLIGIIVPIIAGIKANNGEWYRIPYIVRLIK